MSRITGPKCRLCRREQTKLFLKGDRCFSDKCAVVRRQSLPGKTSFYTSRPSNYGIRLREKQKVKRMYGLNERQMKKTFEEASNLGGDTGLNLLKALEMRLDNVMYLLGMAPSRAAARQKTTHGKVKVNGKRMKIPSYKLSVGDKIEFINSNVAREGASGLGTPSWLKKNAKGGEVVNEPERSTMAEDIKEYLIIEFYSR